jgi:hypothetical protein
LLAALTALLAAALASGLLLLLAGLLLPAAALLSALAALLAALMLAALASLAALLSALILLVSHFFIYSCGTIPAGKERVAQEQGSACCARGRELLRHHNDCRPYAIEHIATARSNAAWLKERNEAQMPMPRRERLEESRAMAPAATTITAVDIQPTKRSASCRNQP